jgi:hypothetical protein
MAWEQPPQPASLPTPMPSPFFQVAQAIFQAKPFPIQIPHIFNPSHASYLLTYKDGTERSETFAFKLRRRGITQKKAYDNFVLPRIFTWSGHRPDV